MHLFYLFTLQFSFTHYINLIVLTSICMNIWINLLKLRLKQTLILIFPIKKMFA